MSFGLHHNVLFLFLYTWEKTHLHLS